MEKLRYEKCSSRVGSNRCIELWVDTLTEWAFINRIGHHALLIDLLVNTILKQ